MYKPGEESFKTLITEYELHEIEEFLYIFGMLKDQGKGES